MQDTTNVWRLHQQIGTFSGGMLTSQTVEIAGGLGGRVWQIQSFTRIPQSQQVCAERFTCSSMVCVHLFAVYCGLCM